MASRHANDDDLADAAERDHVKLRHILDQTHYLLRRAQELIERTRPRKPR